MTDWTNEYVMEGKKEQVAKHRVKEPLKHSLMEDKHEQIFFSLRVFVLPFVKRSYWY